MSKNNYNITKEEIESIKTYITKDHLAINSMVETGLDNEERIEKILGYEYLSEEDIKKYIEKIKNIYSAMLKYTYNVEEENEITKVYRGTSLEEVKKMKSSKKYNRFCSATLKEKIANEKYTALWVDKAVIEISLAVNVPYIEISKIISKSNENEIIVSPFTRINKIEKVDNNKYVVAISKMELEKEPCREEKVYKETKEANEALKELFVLKKDIDSMYQKKDELLSHLLNSAEVNKTEDKKKINEEVKVLEKDIETKTNEANKLEVKYSSWKRELNSVIRTKLKEVEVEIEKENEKVEKERKIKQEEERKIKKKEEEKKIKDLIETSIILDGDEKMQKAAKKSLVEINEKTNPVSMSIKEIALTENSKLSNKINKLKMDLNELDKSQKKYEDFSKKIGSKYTKKINVIDIKEALYDLETSINKLGKKIQKAVADETSESEEYFTTMSNMEKEINEEVERLAKDVISVINKEELIEFRKGIYEKVIIMKSKMDLKDLTNQRNRIEKKSAIIKVINKLIRKDRKDNIKIDNIDVKIAAINSSLKTLKNKEKKSINIYKIIIILDEYISKNLKNPVLKVEVSEMQKLRVALVNIFNIDEKRMLKEKSEKEISNLPTTKNGIKISYEELEKWKTNDWIKRNGYVYTENKNTEETTRISVIDHIKELRKKVDKKLKR